MSPADIIVSNTLSDAGTKTADYFSFKPILFHRVYLVFFIIPYLDKTGMSHGKFFKK
jgi:hypothetical protein